jgi:hypothetical protein
VGTLFAIGYRADATLPTENNSTKDIRSFSHSRSDHSFIYGQEQQRGAALAIAMLVFIAMSIGRIIF